MISHISVILLCSMFNFENLKIIQVIQCVCLFFWIDFNFVGKMLNVNFERNKTFLRRA